MTKRGGLGRNLSVLLGQSDDDNSKESIVNKIDELPIKHIVPGKYQPRADFNEAALSELAGSIEKQGLLQPLVLRKTGHEKYEIIAGERRWRACNIAGLKTVPVIIRQVNDETAMAMALVENLQREDLNAIDQARAIHRLTDEFDLTHAQVAELLSKSRASVSNFLRLLQLCPDVMRLVEHGDIEMGHARCLLMLTDDQQKYVAELVVLKNLSVRETEKLVNRVKNGHQAEQSATPPDYGLFKKDIDHLIEHFNTQVKLKPRKGGKGSLVFDYSNEKELQALIKALNPA